MLDEYLYNFKDTFQVIMKIVKILLRCVDSMK